MPAVRSLLGLALACGIAGGAPPVVNPLLPTGPDPWILREGGFYHHVRSSGTRIVLRKTPHLGALGKADEHVLWEAPAEGPVSHAIWAPEIHRFDGKWYVYFSGNAGEHRDHRIWALENPAADPAEGTWTLKGPVAAKPDRWAIDGSAFEYRGRRYFVWSGWPGADNGTQNIYLAEMENPWTLKGERVRVSTPTFPWEKIWKQGGNEGPGHIEVNEGPEALVHDGRLFLVHSASGCWTDSYCLALVMLKRDGDPLDPEAWEKHPEPVFRSLPEARAYGTGHHCFFRSPDGTETWIAYHANAKPGQGCGRFRSPRAQPISWRPDGTPDFGQPVPLGTAIPAPSGE